MQGPPLTPREVAGYLDRCVVGLTDAGMSRADAIAAVAADLGVTRDRVQYLLDRYAPDPGEVASSDEAAVARGHLAPRTHLRQVSNRRIPHA